ncbi:MAG: hypothetical protein A2021_03800 [Elusimicrobia bacterium GWF2_52_66]|nr:MAG: hypothetical protein A2X33_10085 [Elusimicrobia bacterium GWA2_51_34]OGR84712.1 MAG: hypothetical protein A2021_03800 [Elusimicrobia bacterium GWF2_52_66]
MPELICYTIGHSNHTTEKFVGLLRQHKIAYLADVRSSPYSQHVPQFNKEVLDKELKKAGIQYLFLGKELGARYTDSQLFFDDGGVDFEKVRNTPNFKAGINRIIDGINQNFKIALMCTEKDPLDCHRFVLVSYALKMAGINVIHILDDGGTVTNEAIEDRLLQKKKKNTAQPSLFDGPEKVVRLKEDLLEEAYRERNIDIAYRVEEPEE